MTSCPVPATVTAVARVGPAGGAVEVEVNGDASSGAAELVARVPIDAALGTWTAEASCLDANGDVVDGPVTAEFDGGRVRIAHVRASHRCVQGAWSRSRVLVARPAPPSPPSRGSLVRATTRSRCSIRRRPAPPSTLTGGGSFSGRLTVPADAPEGENLAWVYCVSEGGEPVAGPIAGTFVVDNSDLPPTGRTTEVLLLSGLAVDPGGPRAVARGAAGPADGPDHLGTHSPSRSQAVHCGPRCQRRRCSVATFDSRVGASVAAVAGNASRGSLDVACGAGRIVAGCSSCGTTPDTAARCFARSAATQVGISGTG